MLKTEDAEGLEEVPALAVRADVTSGPKVGDKIEDFKAFGTVGMFEGKEGSYVKERKEIEASVSSSDLVSRYDRVRKHRGGIGVAPARNEVCEICQVRIRPQVFQEILKNDQIIACDACQRILYDPENLDHPFEVACRSRECRWR
jgi:hypothetical protein